MKTRKPVETIDEYIGAFPDTIRQILQSVRTTLQQAAPAATETIRYQIPTFTFNGNLVHFAAYKHHIGFYPTPSGITAFKKELAVYKTSKGAVQFPLDKPIPLDLIRLITLFRVKENQSK
jgi:uncharacterized protein YdhG (YjbR/CyaY superfamily)